MRVFIAILWPGMRRLESRLKQIRVLICLHFAREVGIRTRNRDTPRLCITVSKMLDCHRFHELVLAVAMATTVSGHRRCPIRVRLQV